MNLTGRPVYQKGQKNKKRNRPANKLERRYWEKVRAVGCIVKGYHKGRITIHHTGTGAGGRKDHMKVLPLCEHHHTGDGGINGSKISRREWEDTHGSEIVLLKRLERILKQRGDLCHS